MDKTDAMAHYANRVKADTEIVNAIQYGKLKIVAKLGELMPAATASERGAKGGRGKKATSSAEGALAPETIASYRKVAKNKSTLDSYRDKCGSDEELTLGGFIRFATGTEKAFFVGSSLP